MQDSPDFARSTILHFKPSIIYNLTGICTITRITSRDPWTAGLRYPTVLGTTSLFIEAMDQAYQEFFSLSSLIGKPIMIVFPTQVGLDFTIYNNYPADLVSPHQRILNNAISEINRYIITLNRAMHIRTPFLSAPIHPRCRHRNRATYTKLIDGCHPSEELCEIWAQKLARNVRQNGEYYPTYHLINHMY